MYVPALGHFGLVLALFLASSSAFLRLPGDESPLKTAATPPALNPEFLRAKGLGRALVPGLAVGLTGAAAGIDAGVVFPPLGVGPPPGLATAGVAAELSAAASATFFASSASFSAGVFSPARLRSAPATSDCNFSLSAWI